MKFYMILYACIVLLLQAVVLSIDNGVFRQVDVFIGAVFLVLFRLSIFVFFQSISIFMIIYSIKGRNIDPPAKLSQIQTIKPNNQPISFWLYVIFFSFLGLQMLVDSFPSRRGANRVEIIEKADSMVLSVIPRSWFPVYNFMHSCKT